jgi:PKD repeat protein
MSRFLDRSLLCVAALIAACGGEGKDLAAPNLSPAAAFGSSCANLSCSFSDSSTDADGRIAAYRWSFGDESADGTTRNATHTYPAPGTYTVALTVTDDDGATDSVASIVQMVVPPPPNAAPVASFGSSCVDLTCNFADSSTDADGAVVGHHWTFGDGEEAEAADPAHTYASTGVYFVQLVVTDDRGATGSAKREVTVSATPVHGPAIAVSDNSIRFCFAPGMFRNCVFLNEDIRITSIDGTRLSWTASSDQPWLIVSPAAGTTPTTMRVSVDTRELPPRNGLSSGAFGTITVSADGATNSLLTIPVSVSFVAILLPR